MAYMESMGLEDRRAPTFAWKKPSSSTQFGKPQPRVGGDMDFRQGLSFIVHVLLEARDLIGPWGGSNT